MCEVSEGIPGGKKECMDTQRLEFWVGWGGFGRGAVGIEARHLGRGQL